MDICPCYSEIDFLEVHHAAKNITANTTAEPRKVNLVDMNIYIKTVTLIGIFGCNISRNIA